ncbi:MAG: hypothetical protein C0508_21245 [Cyanobacteria bacterium PR.023]|nr:hypothetical protein [Cyanobacteria bacterium PR.023]
MFARKNLVQAALIASSISLVAATQPAWSNQWTDMFRTLLIPQTGVASTDSIAARDTQITNRIIDAINANKLSTIDTQNLKSQLDRIKSMESGYRANRVGGQLDAIETATLNAELNKVEISLNQMLGLASNTSTTLGASVTTSVDNFDASLAELKQRISKNLTTGRLTIDEARSLTNQYNRVLSDRNSFKADGTLTFDETNRLNQQIDELKRSITANNHDIQVWPGIDGQQAAQAKRIDDGIAAGRVSRTEYEQLKAESNRIANQETLARTNGLQLEETIALATSLRDLDKRISVSLNNSVGSGFGGNPYQGGWSHDRDGMGDRDGRDFDMRQSYILKRIDEATANGRLDAAEAADLRADYTRLEQLEASYRADGRLSSSELNVLQQGLESITTELKEKSASIAVQYPEIDRKQTELKAKIDQGVLSGKIKRFDGQKLSGSLAWIASVEAAFRQSGGTLDKAEADRIIADLDRLSAKIDRSSSNPLQELITRKNDLQRKIDENSASGKLSYRAARNLRRDLDRISFSLAAYSPTATIPTADIVRITADMDRLNTGITSGLTYGGDYRSGGRGDWNQR